MFDLELNVKNFLAIREANIKSKNNITVIVAPNGAGKTQIMLLLYAIFWTCWKISKENGSFEPELKRKIEDVFLLKSVDEIVSWDKDSCSVELSSDLLYITFNSKPFKLEKLNTKDSDSRYIEKSPIYLQLSGLGDYYKGIYSLKKYYPHWKLISEAVSDLLTDIFILYSGKANTENKNQHLLEIFERLFNSKFYIQNDRIYINEKEKKYGVEKAASGLKVLSWFYLILRYDLVGDVLFIDEPEVNLHPMYIDKLAYFLYELSKSRKIFVATHSDYLLESFNKLMNKQDFRIDVWNGTLKEDGMIYTSYQADKDNLIDTSPLTDVYLDILKEGFGNE